MRKEVRQLALFLMLSVFAVGHAQAHAGGVQTGGQGEAIAAESIAQQDPPAVVEPQAQNARPPRLALCGKKTQFHLVNFTGTVLYCYHGVNYLQPLQYYYEDAWYWYYRDAENPTRRWAIAKRRTWCPYACKYGHVIWFKAPDLGIHNWKYYDCACVTGPGHYCNYYCNYKCNYYCNYYCCW